MIEQNKFENAIMTSRQKTIKNEIRLVAVVSFVVCAVLSCIVLPIVFNKQPLSIRLIILPAIAILVLTTTLFLLMLLLQRIKKIGKPKKKTYKRVCYCITILLFLFFCAGFFMLASYQNIRFLQGFQFQYILDGDSIVLTAYKGKGGDIDISEPIEKHNLFSKNKNYSIVLDQRSSNIFDDARITSIKVNETQYNPARNFAAADFSKIRIGSGDKNYAYFECALENGNYFLSAESGSKMPLPNTCQDYWAGYNFAAWEDGSGETISSMEVVVGDTWLYAKRSPIVYQISYDGNTPPNSSRVVEGSMGSSAHTYDVFDCLIKNEYTLYGYGFAGWNSRADGKGIVYADKESVKNLTSTENAEITLYACWKANSNISVYFDSNGGSHVGVRSVTFDSKYGAMNQPTKAGYSFRGWFTKNGHIEETWGTQVTSATVVDNLSNHYLYARWEANTYSVAYNSNKPDTVGVMSGSMVSSTHTYDEPKNLLANGFSLTGWTFKNWNTKSDGSGTAYSDMDAVKNLTASNSVVLYAQWTRKLYTINYNLGGGEADNPAYYSIDTQTFTLSKPSLANSVFVGWSEVGTNTVLADITVNKGSTGNKTYTAEYLTTHFSSITEYNLAKNIQIEHCAIDLQNHNSSESTKLAIKAHTKQIEIVGKAAVINNFKVFVDARTSDLEIILNGMNWKADSGVSFDAEKSGDAWVTINHIGTNEIQGASGQTGENGTAAISAANLKITGTGLLTVAGGNGGNGKDIAALRTNGGEGGKGGNAVVCSNLEISALGGTVKLFGGNGGSGGVCGDGGSGAYYGTKSFLISGTGGYGGHAIRAVEDVFIDGSGGVVEIGGGSGGNGGRGNNALNEHLAGSGGNGGYAGSAIVAGGAVTLKSVGCFGGKGGNGGRGGDGFEYWGAGGFEGDAGNGGYAMPGAAAVCAGLLTKGENVVLCGGGGGSGGSGGKGKVYNFLGWKGADGITRLGAASGKEYELL